ncbi:hypothetical protein T4A_3741 [Trichinella pseudospiralis]|uniref:Uncharacterized protein n=1 Tax=Trichinella pseudospiralis TaxID=6337 RepID=A0A0V1EUU5_TRIPS|nr:hypothetical protein T4A_3741 [Trichinella pseudospiralis]
MRDAKFIMGNKRILPIFICEQTTTTGAASEIVKSQRNGTQNVKIYRDADALSGKDETKTSIRCGNSAAEEFDVKQKFAPTLSQVLCSLLDRAYADNLEVERTLAQIKSHFY